LPHVLVALVLVRGAALLDRLLPARLPRRPGVPGPGETRLLARAHVARAGPAAAAADRAVRVGRAGGLAAADVHGHPEEHQRRWVRAHGRALPAARVPRRRDPARPRA